MAKDAKNKTGETKVSMYEVRLRPGHPTGSYRRAGCVFQATSPTYLEEVPDAVANDHWLIVSAEAIEVPAA